MCTGRRRSAPVPVPTTVPFAEADPPSTTSTSRPARPRRDGLLPFVIKRLQRRPRIRAAGHAIRFAVSRGPLNIASFLMGTTEFLMEMKLNPDKIHHLLRLITDFTRDWLGYQRECFPTIDGVLLLDDIVGFIGEEDYEEFAQPYLKELFTALGVSVRFFHNDSPCTASAPHLHDTGINLYNMGIEVTVKDLQEWTDGQVTLMGNIPPRDVLASGTRRTWNAPWRPSSFRCRTPGGSSSPAAEECPLRLQPTTSGHSYPR
jgi:uroporphyrinogen decarboxylase